MHSYRLLKNEYKNLLYKLALMYKRNWKTIPLEFEDLLSYLDFFFYELTVDYDLSSPKTFPSYIKEYLQYKMLNVLRTLTSKNHSILNNASTFDETFFLNKNQEEADFSFNFDIQELIKLNKLTKLEQHILELVIKKNTYEQIALILNKDKRSIYTAFHRAKQKILTKIEKQ